MHEQCVNEERGPDRGESERLAGDGARRHHPPLAPPRTSSVTCALRRRTEHVRRINRLLSAQASQTIHS